MRPLSRTGNYISTRIGKAIADYDLIKDGDKILVAVSGGKDSLSLLHLLNARKAWAPIDYELIAMHVESDYHCGACVHTKVLKNLFESYGIRYHFEKMKILGGTLKKRKRPSCFWCSWNRRKVLFLAADKLGCNKVAFGHHKDDIIETLLLNLFYHGEFSAMNPKQKLFGGALTIIRPLCHVEEDALKKFALECNFPSQLCRCPNSETSKRRMMKNFVKEVEKDCKYAKLNLFRSIGRIKNDYIQIKQEEDDGKGYQVIRKSGGRLPGDQDIRKILETQEVT